MNREGKATTIFLLALAILSLCLTAGTLVLFKQEKDKRLSLEQQLDQITNAKLQLEKKSEELKKQSLLLEEKLKDSDTRYANLTNELDIEKSSREQMALENNDLKNNLSKENKAKEAIQQKLSHAVGELKALKNKLQSLGQERTALEAKIKDISSGEVSLDKIVVNSSPNNEGSIVVVNREHDFAVINLGEPDGMTVDKILSVYRAKKYLGDIKIERVQNNLSVADFIPPLNKDKVREGDKVVLKK